MWAMSAQLAAADRRWRQRLGCSSSRRRPGRRSNRCRTAPGFQRAARDPESEVVPVTRREATATRRAKRERDAAWLTSLDGGSIRRVCDHVLDGGGDGSCSGLFEGDDWIHLRSAPSGTGGRHYRRDGDNYRDADERQWI